MKTDRRSLELAPFFIGVDRNKPVQPLAQQPDAAAMADLRQADVPAMGEIITAIILIVSSPRRIIPTPMYIDPQSPASLRPSRT